MRSWIQYCRSNSGWLWQQRMFPLFPKWRYTDAIVLQNANIQVIVRTISYSALKHTNLPAEVVVLWEVNPFPMMKISCSQESECASSNPSGGKIFTQSPCETIMFSSCRLLPEEDEESSSDLPLLGNYKMETIIVYHINQKIFWFTTGKLKTLESCEILGTCYY